VKIERIKKHVEVVFEDGTRMEGLFFLSPASAYRLGEESIEELLNGDRKSLPMQVNQKDVVLLSRSAIVMALSKEKEIEPIPANAKKIPVEIVLRSGQALKGEIYNDLPLTYSRLSDYLNRSDIFFRLEMGDRDCFVSNQFVRLIKPADPEEAQTSR
jgi:hypothetical protein